MRSIKPGTDIEAGTFGGAARKSRKSNILTADSPRICGQSIFENQQRQLLYAVKSGNIQCQKQVLSEIYRVHQMVRTRTGGRTLSRNQFLSEMQHFLERQGLAFDKCLLRIGFDK